MIRCNFRYTVDNLEFDSHWDKKERQFYWETYLSYLDLKCGLWISKMGFVVLYGFIPSIETISTLVAVPVSTFKFLFSFDDTNNITVVTASQNFKPCKLNIIKSSSVIFIHFFEMTFNCSNCNIKSLQTCKIYSFIDMLYTKMSFEYDRIMIEISLHTKRAVHVDWTVLASVVHTSDRIIVVFCAFYSYTWMSLHVQEKNTDSLDQFCKQVTGQKFSF